jgi:hypothetical protein
MVPCFFVYKNTLHSPLPSTHAQPASRAAFLLRYLLNNYSTQNYFYESLQYFLPGTQRAPGPAL